MILRAISNHLSGKRRTRPSKEGKSFQGFRKTHVRDDHGPERDNLGSPGSLRTDSQRKLSFEGKIYFLHYLTINYIFMFRVYQYNLIRISHLT